MNVTSVENRQNVWFVFLFILMVLCGVLVLGYWQTYDLNCGGVKPTWVWTKAPPQFACKY